MKSRSWATCGTCVEHLPGPPKHHLRTGAGRAFPEGTDAASDVEKAGDHCRVLGHARLGRVNGFFAKHRASQDHGAPASRPHPAALRRSLAKPVSTSWTAPCQACHVAMAAVGPKRSICDQKWSPRALGGSAQLAQSQEGRSAIRPTGSQLPKRRSCLSVKRWATVQLTDRRAAKRRLALRSV